MTSEALWVYAVRRADTALPELPGVAGEKLRTVGAAGLSAVVGAVPLPDFGVESLARHLNDLDWLAATARTHNAVIEAVAYDSTAIPVRLAVIFRDDESVRALLTEHRDEFDAALDLVEGRAEWGVKAFLRRPAVAEPAAAPSSGADYLRRRREALHRNRTEREIAEKTADEIYHALSPFAVGARTRPAVDPSLSGFAEPMLLNAAYLVDDARSGEFLSAVAELTAAHPEITIERTGPWLPYSFVGGVGDIAGDFA
ncbi:GvpL/GvpF family gas vesicle protein [Nocardia sp. NPDC050406]|uniref:GvpL/GvpF family gas vesicle protein n=1 Tax=Nocardia sp. NPDC050406 TaxID=3364318 RepID=UPI0037A36B80